MLLKRSSPLVRLWLHLPVWFGRVEAVRVGDDVSSYVRISFN